ncbi:hypothetical protein ACFPYJ_11200 [Paenibacillus solisilvae]|uniref:DUF3299 domain-containing protein n=1 Tax=Paenibacillus solisilvae TaxID=2486751 RepID=A0ABW0VUY8_9BACL
MNSFRRSLQLLTAVFLIVILFGCGPNNKEAEAQVTGAVKEDIPVVVQAKKEYQKLTFDELYSDVETKTLSHKTQELSGQPVLIEGYMAPPLTAEIEFFVLTRYMMEQCPFCAALATWPADIVVVYLPEGEPMEVTDHPLIVKGRLEIGEYKDELTGFVSLVRLYAEKIEVLE